MSHIMNDTPTMRADGFHRVCRFQTIVGEFAISSDISFIEAEEILRVNNNLALPPNANPMVVCFDDGSIDLWPRMKGGAA